MVIFIIDHMTTEEECESLGMEFVEGHANGKGGYIRAFCRKGIKDRILGRGIKIEYHNDPRGSLIGTSSNDLSLNLDISATGSNIE